MSFACLGALLSLGLSVFFNITQCSAEDGDAAVVGYTGTKCLVKALTLLVILMQGKWPFKACINGSNVNIVLLGCSKKCVVYNTQFCINVLNT